MTAGKRGTSATAEPTRDERPDRFRTTSGRTVDPVYTPAHVAALDYARDLSDPGEFPFTRGIHRDGYAGKFWTMRQFAGFGTPEETNRRYHHLLGAGQTGLSVAFDLPTQMGHDSDAPMAAGEVGRVGVAIDSLEDMRALFDGIRLDSVSTSMTINSTAGVLLAFYIAVADEQGVPRDRLYGTLQNDILKEYIARGTYIYPVDASLRLVADVMAFCARETPRWNPISISGYHIREAGATAPQELAFTFANALEYVERALGAQIALEEFAPRLSFFFAAHNDFFEEVAKFRAARRLWARLMHDRYGASDEAARLRFHTQTGGSTLTAQQPLNNVVRVTVQALAAVLGGTQSLHTNSYDEALALPTEESARLALRTQQILALESGVTLTADPLGGSWYVERLTDEIEARALALLLRIGELGGAANAIDFMAEEIHRSAYTQQMAIEAGERTVVGVNSFTEAEEATRPVLPDYSALEARQCEKLTTLRARRNGEEVTRALGRVASAANGDENLVPPMVAAVKALATLGEVSDTLRAAWGTYDEGLPTR